MQSMSPQLWQQLLALKEGCTHVSNSTVCIGFSEDKHVFWQHEQDIEGNWPVILSLRPLSLNGREDLTIFTDKLNLSFCSDLSAAQKSLYCLYLPLATVSFHHPNQPFVIVHMAQSLDGMVCTHSGNSKWIGNQQNLTHAHRLRALVDGVVVGGKTARLEKPSLNVRHVSGPDPARILLCNSSDNLHNLPVVSGMRNFILCEDSKMENLDEAVLNAADLVAIAYRKEGNKVDLDGLQTQLLAHGIQSVLLEGGPTTIQTFVSNQSLNWLQLHIAPIVFGSGKPFLSLPQINSVDQALKMENVFYTQMGDAMMVTGEL